MSTLAPGVGQEVVVEIQSLDDEGAGVCALEVSGEHRLHVSGALPGEQVRAQIEHLSHHRSPTGQRPAFGRTLAVLRASEARVAPACPAHGRCGGCPVQHLAYPEQLAWKQARVQAALAGHPALAGAPVLPVVPSPRPLGYRNQAKYVYGRTPPEAGGQLALGAWAPRGHQLVDLLGCQIVEPVLDVVARAARALLVARQVAPFDEIRRTGVLRYLVLRASGEGRVLCTLVTGGRPLDDGPGLAQALMAAVPAVAGVLEGANDSRGNAIFGPDGNDRVLAGAGSLSERLAGLPVAVGPRSFLQLNRQVAEAAYAAIRQAAEGLGTLGRVVDLFAGLGGISFALRDLAREIVAVEQNPAATSAGAAAARAAGLEQRLRFVTGSAADAGEGLLAGADLVVLNPPRAGAAAVLPALLAGRPRAVIYLSCNPATLARDLATLTGDERLRLVQVQPFDMLPHTPHIEALALLKNAW